MDWFMAALQALGSKLDVNTVITLAVLVIFDRRLAALSRDLVNMVKSLTSVAEQNRGFIQLQGTRMDEIRRICWEIARALGAHVNMPNPRRKEPSDGNKDDLP